MRNTILRITAFLLCILAVAAARADMLKVKSREYQGTFQGYKAKKFIFRTKSGKLLKQTRSSVSCLQLDEPTEVRFRARSKKKPEEVMLIGYDNGKFSIERNGKGSGISGMSVEEITVMRQATSHGNGDTRAAIAPIDLTGIENAELTPQQSSAVQRYKRARSSYDSFLSKSSALVAQMDKANGSTRSSLLMQLRSRKDQEQPIKREMEAAHAGMLSAFPGLANGGRIELKPKQSQARQPKQGPAKRYQKGTVITLVVPKVGPNEVFIIDTSCLKQLGELNADQKAAMKTYDAAARQYERFVADPATVAKEKDPAQLKVDLRNAQEALLKSFPALKLVEE